MSASLAAVTLCNAIIPVLPSFRAEDLRTVKVEHSWMTGNGANAVNHSYKMYLPMCDDLPNKELLLYIIDQFLDAAHNDRLHLSTWPLSCAKFRDIVGGDLHVVWQEISDAQGAKSINSFVEDIDVLVGNVASKCCMLPQANKLCQKHPADVNSTTWKAPRKRTTVPLSTLKNALFLWCGH